MRKVSILAAIFFALAWLAVADDGDAPQPTRPILTPTPTIQPPQYAPRAVGPVTSDAPAYLTPQPAYYAPTPFIANVWQIHRTDADTLLLNTATGETWFLDRTGEEGKRQYTWQPIARKSAYGPPDHPAATFPAAERPPYSAPQDGERPAEPPRMPGVR